MKEAFKKYIFKANLEGSNKAPSYLKALELLETILSQPSTMYSSPVDFWQIDSQDEIERLYQHALEYQKKEGSEFLNPDFPPSYGRNGYYSAALKSYAEFLTHLKNVGLLGKINNTFEQTEMEDVLKDIETTLNDDSIPNQTERETIAKSRIGQGKFRENLVNYWHKCSVTGFPDVRFLRASHIKPWKKSDNKERMDVYNGLLLLPNLDLVFDKGFITFDDKGKIVISKDLEQPKMLGINSGMGVKIKPKHKEYLEYHRDNVYEKAG